MIQEETLQETESELVMDQKEFFDAVSGSEDDSSPILEVTIEDVVCAELQQVDDKPVTTAITTMDQTPDPN